LQRDQGRVPLVVEERKKGKKETAYFQRLEVDGVDRKQTMRRREREVIREKEEIGEERDR